MLEEIREIFWRIKLFFKYYMLFDIGKNSSD